MGCVRKRGKSWNAQVRIAGWRSFTKSFKSKSDAVCWVQQKEHQLKNTSLPSVDVERDGEKLGAVFFGSDSPFTGSQYGFLGIFKNHEDLKEAMSGFGDLADTSHHYD